MNIPDPSIDSDLAIYLGTTEVPVGEWFECLQTPIKGARVDHIYWRLDVGQIIGKLFRLLDAFRRQRRICRYASRRLD